MCEYEKTIQFLQDKIEVLERVNTEIAEEKGTIRSSNYQSGNLIVE